MNQKPEQKVQCGNLMYIPAPIRYRRLHPHAEEPFKENPSDIGHIITLIGRYNNRSEDITGEVNEFTTGIQVSPPKGYYIELIADQNLYKTGYMLISGVQVINPDKKDELIIPLYKFKEGEDLELPFKGIQMVIREAQYSHIMPVLHIEEKQQELLFSEVPSFGGGYDMTKPRLQNNNQPRRLNNKPNNHMF